MHQIIEDPIDNAIAMVSDPNFIDSNQNYDSNTEIAQFKRFSTPLIKRIYPSLISSNIQSIQPLNTPSSLVYYYRNTYRNTQSQGRGYSLPMELIIGEKPKVDWKKEGF